MMDDLVSSARTYATEAHQRIDHLRKYTHQPYQVHLQAVAKLVASITPNPTMIAAAWLHDTVEDTPATLSDIERTFGTEVAGLVEELTDVSMPSDGNRAARKAIDRAHTAKASPQAKTIKLADLIDNCQDICRHDPEFGKVYLREMALLMEVLTEGDAGLYQMAQNTLARYTKHLGITLPSPLPEEVPFEPPHALETIGNGRGSRIFIDAFKAEHIAESLSSFDQERPMEDIANIMEEKRLSVAGLRQAGRTTGFLFLDRSGDAAPVLSPHPFSDYQVVAFNAPLSQVIEVLTRYQYCFVRVLGDVCAVITRACMQKPCVRMWLFGIVTLFEMYMTERIAARWAEEEWAHLLSPSRLEKARLFLEERLRRNQPVRLLDCLQFSDKAAILLDDPAQLALLGLKTKTAGKQLIKEIEALRNDLAHSQDIVTRNWPQIARFARRVEESSHHH